MKWQFDILQSGSIEGWNHSGLAHFRASPLKSLIRETLQNSLDNPNPEIRDEPVRILFKEHWVSRDLIPGIDDLRDQLALCKQDSVGANEEARKGIDSALRGCTSDRIKVLQISDYNTTGMIGPDRGTPFHNYLKTSGDSLAETNRGGSHGIGKFAPVANTHLRTIFVSTCWKDLDSTEEKSLFQGCTFLSGRQLPDGTTISQKGYLGEQKFEPFEFVPEGFSWMDREEIGTSLFLIGWDSPPNWSELSVAYALTNYFAAFARGKLELHVESLDGHKVFLGPGSNFEHYFENEQIHAALRKHTDDGVEELRHAKYYLSCINGGSKEHKNAIQPHIGHSSLKLLLHEDAHQKIAFIRNNIFITDAIPHFYKRSSREFSNYAGVFEVNNSTGEKFLRRMENPSHTELSHEWLPRNESKKGSDALRSIGNWLKEVIKAETTVRSDLQAGPIEILKNFFGDAAGEGADDLENEDIDPSGIFKVIARPLRKAPLPLADISEQEEDEEDDDDSSDNIGNAGGAANKGGGGGGSRAGHGSGHGSGTGGTGTTGTRARASRKKNIDSVRLKRKRIISIQNQTVTVVLESEKNQRLRVSLHEVGADYSERLAIAQSSLGEISSGDVVLSLNKFETVRLDVTTESSIVGGAKLVVKGA